MQDFSGGDRSLSDECNSGGVILKVVVCSFLTVAKNHPSRMSLGANKKTVPCLLNACCYAIAAALTVIQYYAGMCWIPTPIQNYGFARPRSVEYVYGLPTPYGTQSIEDLRSIDDSKERILLTLLLLMALYIPLHTYYTGMYLYYYIVEY